MSDVTNSITNPLGFKLFSGGPYSDAGIGNEQKQQVQQYMAQLAPIIGEIAKSAGVTNPVTGEKGAFSDDPYGLSPLQHGEVNRQAGVDTQAMDAIMAKVKANLNARGMNDSSTLTAAQTYLQSQLQQEIGGERVQAGQNAYSGRMNALQQIAQLLSGGYQAQAGVTSDRKNTAISMHQNAMQQLGSLLALGMQAGGVGAFGGGKGAPTPAGGSFTGKYPGYGMETSPATGGSFTGGVPNIYAA